MRRIGPTLALTAVVGGTFASAPPASAASVASTGASGAAKVSSVAARADAATPSARRSALTPGDTAYVDVAVATLWTAPGLARTMDAPSLTNPVDLRRWNRNMARTADRAWLSEGKLETQAALGSRVQVTAVQGSWVKVVVAGQSTPRDPRGYPGWMPAVQLRENARFARLFASRRHAVVTDKTTWLTTTSSLRRRASEISFNTELPVVTTSRRAVQVALPSGRNAWVDARDVAVRRPGQQPKKPNGAAVVATGSRFLGLRYLWAGVSAFGFDCSGFTSSVFRAHGITLPRDSGPQSKAGKAVSRANLRPGDLVFFAKPGGVGSVHHVAIYAGRGKILHSPNSARNVEIVDLAAFDVNKEYSGARRYL